MCVCVCVLTCSLFLLPSTFLSLSVLTAGRVSELEGEIAGLHASLRPVRREAQTRVEDLEQVRGREREGEGGA